MTIFETNKGKKDFGNGRFARGLVERAMMKQASRLIKTDIKVIFNEDITMLLPEDFEDPRWTYNNTKGEIGFRQ